MVNFKRLFFRSRAEGKVLVSVLFGMGLLWGFEYRSDVRIKV